MELADFVRAILGEAHLEARQWVLDAADLDWAHVPRPDLDGDALALAAGLAELMAERRRVNAPAWTSEVGAASAPMFLAPSARTMPRTRRLCETEGPLPLRRRRIYALPHCFTFA